jgi:hypothetical protein
MSIANWWRKRLNLPVKFDHAQAVDEALIAAHFDLNRLRHPAVLAEVESWESIEDAVTDDVCCDRGVET